MMPLGLSLYRIATHGLAPFAPLWLHRRAKRGKEDATRLGEKLGIASAHRPTGTLVWLHGASVGEAELALNLMRAIGEVRSDVHFLLTTGTPTSAEVMAKRLGDNSRHQYPPLDTPRAARRFIKHWQPDLGIMIESELWPNLILAAQENGVKLALVNARLNAQSLQRWQSVPMSAAHVLNAFDWVGAADGGTRQSLQSFTKKTIINTGNLKHSAPAPSVDENTLARLQSTFGKRNIWLALSTHKGEDEVILAAHKHVRKHDPNAALILVPRHPERANTIALACKKSEIAFICHSTGAMPDTQTSVYIGDSIGEMGLWLRLGAPAFVGGSLFSTMTGHNPLEAAKLGVPVLTGPYRASFYDVYKGLIAVHGVLETRTATEISKAVITFFSDPQHAKTISNAALSCAQNNATLPMELTLKGLLTLIGEGV